jgi:Coenzyme F420-reducing hydrogenase, beta subunit
MRIEMKNGRIMELPKFHANYLIPFHILKNSLLCTDLTNEFTDISGGDAWAPVYEERGKGFSLVIARSKQGQNLLEEMANQHIITLWPIAEEEAIKMHSHGYDLKKRGTFIRMQFRSVLGLKNPDYGYKISGFSLGRYLMEILIDFLFLLLGTKPARYIADHIPQKNDGLYFRKCQKILEKSNLFHKKGKTLKTER